MYSEITRSTDTPAEIIERSNGTTTISGYAVRWYRNGDPSTEYPLGGNRVERIRRHDFEPALSLGDDTALRLNHSKDCELDSTKATLTLRADDTGVRFDCPYDSTDPDHQKVMAKFRKGTIKGCSFRVTARHRYEQEGDRTIAYMTDIQRFTDVSIIGGNVEDRPAYAGTSVMIRSEQDNFQAWEETQKRIAAAEKLV